ncbi:Non-catalytic module family EXPN [Melampsora americana]|nr:Non-catalytic module family EXPN [Melampsora americana]
MFKSILLIIAFIFSTCSATFKGRMYAGRATWFDTSVGLGACGQQSSNSEHIVALNSAQYHSGSHCYSKIKIHNMKSGATIEASIMDECPTCGWGDLDLTPDTFKAIANLDDGIAHIRWSFI